MKLPDATWEVIKDYLREYFDYTSFDGVRNALENHCEISIFDGGVFLSYGNEFDLFVKADKRGRWKIRTEIPRFLSEMGRRHKVLVCRVHERNKKSLRLAKFFGFEEVSKEDGFIRMECDKWAE